MPVFDVVVQDIITGARSGQIKAIVDSGGGYLFGAHRFAANA
jgi:hypothetical protein